MTTPTTVRLSGIEGVAAAVPHMLGFTPAESLVAIALQGPRERMSFTMRVDLNDNEAGLVKVVQQYMATAGADNVMLAVYTEASTDTTDLPRRSLIDGLIDAFPHARDAILVRDNRVFSYLCSNTECCPPEGRLLDPAGKEATALTAAHALKGKAALATREEVVAQYAAPPITAAFMTAFDHACAAVTSVGAVVELGKAAVEVVLSDFTDPRAELDTDTVALMAAWLGVVTVRDYLIDRIASSTDDAREHALLRYLARHTPSPADAAVCSVLAIAEYLDGNGVATSTLLERVLAGAPDYSLARLLLFAIDKQVPPSELRPMFQLTQGGNP